MLQNGSRLLTASGGRSWPHTRHRPPLRTLVPRPRSARDPGPLPTTCLARSSSAASFWPFPASHQMPSAATSLASWRPSRNSSRRLRRAHATRSVTVNCATAPALTSRGIGAPQSSCTGTGHTQEPSSIIPDRDGRETGVPNLRRPLPPRHRRTPTEPPAGGLRGCNKMRSGRVGCVPRQAARW